MSTNRLRWLAAAVTTAALAMTGPLAAQAAGPSDPPTQTSTTTAPTQATTPSVTPTGSATTTTATPTSAPTTTAPSTPAFRKTLVYATATVAVRTTASTSSKALGTLQRGNHVGTRDSGNGTATRNGWTAVTYQGKAAWISAQYLSTTKPAPAPKPSTPAFKKTLVYATTTVTVRTTASTSSKALGTLQRGNHVGTRNSGNGTATRNGWTAVTYQGKAAWISARYLSTTKPAPAAKASTPAFKKYLVYATATVPVRVSPSLAARSVASLKRGNHVSAIGIAQRGFTPVNYRGSKAWVQTSYLSRSKPVANPQRLDKRCLSGLVVCISKTERKLRLVHNGRVLITLDARFGSDFNPTREGRFAIFQKSKNWVSTLYGSKMPYAMFFSGGEAVHYSSDFAARGYVGHSHGCVNIRSWSGIQYVWNHAPIGTTVIVYK